MVPTARACIVLLLVIAVTGCASEIVHSSARLAAPSAGDRQRIEIADETTVRSSSGYSRVLPAGSMWELRGTLPQGSVYRRVKDIFTIEGAHVHEAYLVVADDRLVGYYLPVSRRFRPQIRYC